MIRSANRLSLAGSTSQKLSAGRLEMEATARLGGLLLDANRPDEAELRLRDAQLMAREIEDRRGQALSGLWLGILLWEQEAPRAEQELQRVTQLANEMGLSRVEALALAIQARILRARDQVPQALAMTDRAAGHGRKRALFAVAAKSAV